MKDLLEFLLKEITGKDDFTIEEIQEEDRLILQVKAKADIIGLIIGKDGKTIKAIQDILRVKGSLEKKSVYVSVSEKI